MAASPAMAQGTAASTQIAASVKPADLTQNTLGEGDDEFRDLFASWQSLDQKAGFAAPRMKIAIPSRMPLDAARMTSAFGQREHPVLGGIRAHKGIDLAAPSGTPIYAPADGYVARADRFGSYGNFIELEHGGDIETRYGHLSSFAVHEGDRVHKGELIGYVGTTGRSTGPHLHYEVRIAGEAVNPMPYMSETGSPPLALSEGPGAQGGPEE